MTDHLVTKPVAALAGLHNGAFGLRLVILVHNCVVQRRIKRLAVGFDFGDAQAKEVMVPRIDMTFANIDCTYDELIEIFKEDKFTRLPVYKDTTDNVIGIINMKDLLLYKDREHFSIQDIMREPYFTYEHKNTAELFMEMRKSSISLAIVLDENT